MVWLLKIHMWEKFSECLKRYLRWAHFNIGSENPRYKKRICVDVFAVTAYTVISIILVRNGEADLIVAGLNILCLIRALISNTINASEVAAAREDIRLDIEYKSINYYHLKSCLMGGISFLAMLVWCAMAFEPSYAGIKCITYVAIIVVFMDNCEDIAVCAYNAAI